MYFVPVNILFFEEAVMLVKYGPELLEISAWIVVKLFHIVTAVQKHGCKGYQDCYDEMESCHCSKIRGSYVAAISSIGPAGIA